MLHTLWLQTNTTAAELFKSLNDYMSGKLNWSFCVSICMDGVPSVISSFLVSPLGSKRSILNVTLCTVSAIGKCWLAEKCHLNLKMFCRMRLKLSTTLKYMPLTHICLCSSVRRWTRSTHVFSYTQRDGFLKGRMTTVFISVDKVAAFKAKVELWGQ
ncbi:hypothetical protein AAY473_011024 [Plecturocebus cupreus]